MPEAQLLGDGLDILSLAQWSTSLSAASIDIDRLGGIGSENFFDGKIELMVGDEAGAVGEDARAGRRLRAAAR